MQLEGNGGVQWTEMSNVEQVDRSS